MARKPNIIKRMIGKKSQRDEEKLADEMAVGMESEQEEEQEPLPPEEPPQGTVMYDKEQEDKEIAAKQEADSFESNPLECTIQLRITNKEQFLSVKDFEQFMMEDFGRDVIVSCEMKKSDGGTK